MKPKVLILGSHHMNPTEDMVQSDRTKLLPKRKEEMTELIEKLKTFQPTKVAVEVEVKQQDELNEEYAKYVKDNFTLPIEEAYQIGFRLAKEMSLNQVNAVDWMEILPNQMGFGEVMDWAKTHQPDLYRLINEDISSEMDYDIDGLSLLEAYRKFNDSKNVNLNHQLYMHFARIGDRENENYVAMNWLNWWYQRNLIIYSNLTRLVKEKNERIFLVIGFDHLHTINQFLEESGMFEVEYANEYL